MEFVPLDEPEELDPEELEPDPMPGQWPLGIEPLAFCGFVVLVLPDDPVLLVDPEVPELEVPDVLEVPDPDVPVEPEFEVVELGVVELDVAANATLVPTPASTPVSSNPAASCFVGSFMVHFLASGRPSEGRRHLRDGSRGTAVKSIRRP